MQRGARGEPGNRVRHTSPSHLDKCREALRLARAERAHLLVTPEYSIPLALIGEMLDRPELQPRPHTLWCLGCEGVSWDDFQNHIMQWGDKAIVGKKTLEGVIENRFAGFLLYVFVSAPGDKLCLVPQLKLQRMREPVLVCESSGLSLGKAVVRFGEGGGNELLAILCADAFHPDIRSGSLLFPDREQKHYIVLHPQLNPAPRSDDIAALRQAIFSGKPGVSTVYVTANWAAGTTVRLEHDPAPALSIRSPWSCIYRRFTSLDGAQPWFERLREVRSRNLRHGLGLAFHPEKKYKVWFADKSEHIQQIQLAKPYDGGPEIARPVGTVQAERAYRPSETGGGWQAAELAFAADLPQPLAAEAAGDYAYPLTAGIGDRDKFFGYCLGHLEEGELHVSDKERNARISVHIDDQCEPERVRSAEMVVRLIRCLKRDGPVPSQLRRLHGGYRFQLAAEAPLNLLPRSGSEDSGALVAYVERASAMKGTVDAIYNRMPHAKWALKERICVFSHNAAGEVVYYPQLQEHFTAAERSAHSTDFTDGGATIDAELD
ncbi:hypothetical protein SD70_01975 [Gordoniibacillus kamchatkensis]|uniref:Uncharacterized protein n=1 Tax=Gordoniibacillus kamchatkensis TaxID=1590651 RepID=A0ABR5AMW4_9BACL|nr:hypothetical protein [Paenibacillus sp. VKM B-2647]KIL42307.1 hypothetical protein SD70_01975 [Paenibacillus sp. VKM B-2647]